MSALPEVEHHLVVGRDSDVGLAGRQLPAARVVLEPSLTREVSPITDLRALLRLRHLISRAKPAVVVTHQSKAGVLGRVAAWMAGKVPAVHSLSMASFGHGYPRHQDLLFRMVERGLARITTAYLVVGRDLAARFTSLGIPGDKFHIVRSGLRLEPSEEAKAELKSRLGARHEISDGVPWVVYVGSLEHRKNVHRLPRLIEELVDAMPEPGPHLLIVGEGPLEEEIRAEAAARDVHRHITLTGYSDDAIDYIKAADVVVLLSSAEGLPQVLVQAAAVGTPFVAYAVDGLEELIELGAAGSIVTPDELSTVVDVMAHQLTAFQDSRRIDVASWSEPEIARRYRDFFRELFDF